jgi:hypothetical protein
MNWLNRLISYFKTWKHQHPAPLPVLPELESTPPPKVKGPSRPKVYTKNMKRDIVDTAVNFMELVEKSKRIRHGSRNTSRMDRDRVEAIYQHGLTGEYLLLDEKVTDLLKKDGTPILNVNQKEMLIKREKRDDRSLPDAFEFFQAINGPVDIGLAARDDEKNSYALTRITSVPLETIQDEIHDLDCVAYFYVAIGRLIDDGYIFFDIAHVGLKPEGLKFVSLPYRLVKGGVITTQFDERFPEDAIVSTALGLSAALSFRYDWHVAFGPENGMRLLLPTTAGGSLALFRDREKEGSRRSALRHWVQEHWRETKESLNFVCTHLRGATKFKWRDLACEILVSEHDLERNELFKQSAAEWRAKRPTNQVRVRVRVKKYSDRLDDHRKAKRREGDLLH